MGNEVLLCCNRWPMTFHLITLSWVYGIHSDIEHGVHLLKATLLHDECTGDGWIPTNDPPAPPRPLKSWINDINAIRKEIAAPLQLLHWSEAWLWWCASLLAKSSPRRSPCRRKNNFAKNGERKRKHCRGRCCWMVGPLRQNAIDYKRYFNYLHYTF